MVLLTRHLESQMSPKTGPKMVPKRVPKWLPKWIQNGSQNGSGDGSKTGPKTGPKMVPKIDPKRVPKWVPKWFPKRVPAGSQNGYVPEMRNRIDHQKMTESRLNECWTTIKKHMIANKMIFQDFMGTIVMIDKDSLQ